MLFTSCLFFSSPGMKETLLKLRQSSGSGNLLKAFGHQTSSKGCLKDIRRQYIKERGTRRVYEYDHLATSKHDLTQHKQSLHKGYKYSCKVCEYQTTSRSNLTQRHKSI